METQNTETAIVPIEGRIVSDELLNFEVAPEETEHPNFIESNTQAITIEELATKCIVPTFSDNTLTIAHQNAIVSVYKAAEEVFGELTPPECRVSHAINGRVASALHKPTKDLTDEEKTIFYQRIAFVAHVKSLTRIVAGQPVELTIGMCRSYNEDKLYSRPSPEKFRLFVGWKVRVCSNLCLTCSGNSGLVECMTEADIYQKAYQLFNKFDPEKEETLELLETSITRESPRASSVISSAECVSIRRCPPGYKVPSRDDSSVFFYSKIVDVANGSYATGWAIDATNHWFTVGDPVAVFPLAGKMDKKGNYDGHAKDRAHIWNSKRADDMSGCAQYVYMNSTTPVSAYSWSQEKAIAGSVRCIVVAP